MNNFKFEYKIDEKSVRKMIISGIGARAMIQSALIPAGMFLAAAYLGKIESQPFGYFCFACGIAMMIWIGVQTNKIVQKSYSALMERYHSKDLLAKVEIDDEKILYSVWNEDRCERNETDLLSDMLAFSKNGKLIKVIGKKENDVTFVLGEPSELTRLAEFLKKKDIEEIDNKTQTLGKLASIGIIVISFVLAIYSFFPSSTDVVRYLDAWQKQGAYTSETNWTRNSLSELDSQISSVWTDGDTMYRIEQLEEKDGNSQIVVSSYADGKEKSIHLDAKGNVKRIDEKEVSRSEFFLDPIICPSEDTFLIDSSDTLERNPYFSWKKDGNKVVATLEDPDRFASYRVGKEEDSYTEEQLNSMDTIERMNLHYSGRIKPDHVDFAFVIQDKRIVEIVFDELVQITYPKAVEETGGTTSIHDLSVSSSVQEQVEALFEKPLRHGDVIDLPWNK